MDFERIFLKNVSLLSKSDKKEREFVPLHNNTQLPSVEALSTIVELVKAVIFPDFFDKSQKNEQLRSYYIGLNMERLYILLKEQIARGLLFASVLSEKESEEMAMRAALSFIDHLPEIKRLLYTDAEATFNNDPAVRNLGEVIFCYPIIQAMTNYRIAHDLLNIHIPIIPRIITELAHSKTGIDIHPGARIGEYFSIDHGTGVVIGETCVIGNHVMLYQGVTLGAKNLSMDTCEHPSNIPRHPIIENNVTIYSNSTLLGRITIGHDSIIGGNIWLTHDIPPHSRILQSKAMSLSFTDGLGI